MKKYNHFVENEIGGSYGQSNLGVFMFQMAIALAIILLGILILK